MRKEFLYGAQVDAWAKKVLSLSEEMDLWQTKKIRSNPI